MKGKRIFLGVIIAVMLLAAVALAVFANEPAPEPEYTGTVSGAEQKLGVVDTKGTLKEKIGALDTVRDYIDTIDPAAEGLDAFLEKFEAKKLQIAKDIVAEANGKAEPADKEASLLLLTSFLANHDVTDDSEGDDNLFTTVEALKADIAEKYLEAAQVDGLTADDRHAVLNSLMAYVAAYSPELREGFTADLEAVNLVCAKQYFALEFDAFYDLGANLRILSLFIKEHPATNAEGYNEFYTEFELKLGAYRSEMEAKREQLHKLNHLVDLDKVPLSNHDYTPSDGVTNPNNKTGALLAENNLSPQKDVISFIGQDVGMDGDNGYYTVKYELTGKQMGAAVTVSNISQSVVFEFDFTTFSYLPITGTTLINVSAGSMKVNSSTWTPVLISITADGHIVAGSNKDNVLVKNAITKGEWTHISIVLDYDTNLIDVYVDYELVLADYSVAHASKGYVAAPTHLRFNTTANVLDGEFNIDNLQIYQGHAPRKLDFSTTHTDEEKFVFYVNQIDNLGLSFYARKTYYDTAVKALGNYYLDGEYKTANPETIAAIDKLVFYGTAPDEDTPSGYEKLLQDLSDYNLAELTAAVKKVADMPRTESNTVDRTYLLERADAALAAYGTYIFDNAALSECVAKLNTVRRNLAEEATLSQFVSAVSDFYAAASVANMQEAFKRATDLYKSIDPALASSGFPKFNEAYAKYDDMEYLLRDKIIIENSKRLTACIAFVSSYAPETWDENYEYLLTYVLMARNIIEEGNYDPYYKNGAQAVEDFEPMSEYFYAKMQLKYIEHIEEQLDRAEKSDKYFEKLGICIKLEDYIIENKLQDASERMNLLIEEVHARLEELKGNRAEYEALLKANTVEFVEICKGLIGSIDYSTMKRIVDEASEYYYMMDVSDASAQDAIGIYVARCVEIDAVEAYANEFMIEVALIDAIGSDMLTCIVSASRYLDKLEMNVAGVKNSIARLEAACEAYDNGIKSMNAEIAELVDYSMASTNTCTVAACIITLAVSIAK